MLKFLAMIIWCNTTNCEVQYRPQLFESKEECALSTTTEVMNTQGVAAENGYVLYKVDCMEIAPSA